MAYYISFLKTLSLKLNNHTVHFFYNEVSACRGHLGVELTLSQLGSVCQVLSVSDCHSNTI